MEHNISWNYTVGDRVYVARRPNVLQTILGMSHLYGDPGYYVTDAIVQHNPKSMLHEFILESEIVEVEGYPGDDDA